MPPPTLLIKYGNYRKIRQYLTKKHSLSTSFSIIWHSSSQHVFASVVVTKADNLDNVLNRPFHVLTIVLYTGYNVYNIGLGLWCSTPLSTTIQLYRGGQFYWWQKTKVPGENHWTAASHWQTLSHNVVSCTPCLSGIRTHNFSGDRYWLHR